MKKMIFIIIFSISLPFSGNALGLRNQGEVVLGLTGGYGFPQLGFWGTESIPNRMNKFSKEYSFGLAIDTFLLNNLTLNTEITYTYNTIKLKQNQDNSYDWEGYFIDINAGLHGYWFEFLYFGGGLYARIPYYKIVSDAPGISGDIQFTLGFLLEGGVDMKLMDNFGLKIAIRSHLPFMAYHSIKKNNYTLWALPINFVFALEYII